MMRRNLLCKVSVFSFACFYLSACVSTPPDPELVAAVRPADDADMLVSGDALRACFSDYPKALARLTPDSVAQYNANATYKLADRMRRSGAEIGQYANRLRGYSISYDITSILGTNDLLAVCFYDGTRPNRVFVARLVANGGGLIDSSNIQVGVQDAYESMSGKKLSAWEFMGIPRQ